LYPNFTKFFDYILTAFLQLSSFFIVVVIIIIVIIIIIIIDVKCTSSNVAIFASTLTAESYPL